MKNVTVDILAVGVHPDDVELGCSGTLLRQISLGNSVGILDLTKGELGTRGTAALRMKEVEAATKILGVHWRGNAGFADGFFANDKKHQLKLIQYIRLLKPRVVIANAVYDRHPDHGRAAELVRDACFLAGLPKIKTTFNGKLQDAHRPQVVYHYIQALHVEPDFVVDISPFFKTKLESIRAYSSQFYNPSSKEPKTFISDKGFLEFVEARAKHFGVPAGVQYAEGFTVNRIPAVNDIFHLL